MDFTFDTLWFLYHALSDLESNSKVNLFHKRADEFRTLVIVVRNGALSCLTARKEELQFCFFFLKKKVNEKKMINNTYK